MAVSSMMINMCLRNCSKVRELRNLTVISRFNSDVIFNKRSFHLGIISFKPRKRYQWRMDKPPANTQLAADGEEILETRRTYGGKSKVKAVSRNKGSYILKSQGIELKVPILDVIHSQANKDHVKNKIMTKGVIVELDGTEFKNRLENMVSPNSKEINAENNETPSNIESNEESNEKSPGEENFDKTLMELMNTGKVYGRITTRPGQVGLCDGYVIEGAELEMIMEKLSINANPVN